MHVSVGSHVYVTLTIGGAQVPLITDVVITMGIVTLIIVLLVVLFTRNLQTVPVGPQRYAEWLVSFVNGMAGNIGEHAKVFAPLIGSLFLFLLFSNMLAIFNVVPSGSFLAWVFNNPELKEFEYAFEPPTRNINVTACLALITCTIVVLAEIKYKGFLGWIRSFYTPSPISAFIKILDYAVRPLSLCLRLFGNILGGYISMSLLYSALPLVLPAIVSFYFDLFDGALQAYVFVFLTSMYLSEAVETHHE